MPEITRQPPVTPPREGAITVTPPYEEPAVTSPHEGAPTVPPPPTHAWRTWTCRVGAPLSRRGSRPRCPVPPAPSPRHPTPEGGPVPPPPTRAWRTWTCRVGAPLSRRGSRPRCPVPPAPSPRPVAPGCPRCSSRRRPARQTSSATHSRTTFGRESKEHNKPIRMLIGLFWPEALTGTDLLVLRELREIKLRQIWYV